jgi:hypothetical protein
MRRYWPFLLFAAAVLVNLIANFALWGVERVGFKVPIMLSLLIAVLLIGLVTDRIVLSSRRAKWAFAILAVAIGFSWFGDIGLWFSLELGTGLFVLAQLAYIALFVGPARARPLPWWTIPYTLLYSPIIALLWTHLGDSGSLVAMYGLFQMAVAVTAVGVGRIAAIGALVFLVSETLLVMRMFTPVWLGWFPDPWQDATIMVLYCIGQGLIAFGVLLRLRREPELAIERGRRRAVAQRAAAGLPALEE